MGYTMRTATGYRFTAWVPWDKTRNAIRIHLLRNYGALRNRLRRNATMYNIVLKCQPFSRDLRVTRAGYNLGT